MKKKLTLVITFLILIILLISLIVFCFFNPLLKIKLNGKKNITLEVNNKYKEDGVKISGTKNKYKTIGKVDTTKIGKYTITYQIKYLLTTKKTTRTITIVDTTKPIIELTNNDVTLYINDKYQEPGYKATDNYDQDITKNVKISSTIDTSKAGEYKVIYTVSDSSNNTSSTERKVIVKEKKIITQSGLTYIKGILLVNKKYSLPSTYNPGIDQTANNALKQLQQAANSNGHNIPLVSGFRSYSRQNTIYNNYVARDGQAKADTYSAKPGHSEHQSGLAFDVGKIDDYYGETPAGQWLAQNCHKYGFIIRYLKDKEHITGYKYEPWHIRYVGIEHATNIFNAGLTLEEYLGVN